MINIGKYRIVQEREEMEEQEKEFQMGKGEELSMLHLPRMRTVEVDRSTTLTVKTALASRLLKDAGMKPNFDYSC